MFIGHFGVAFAAKKAAPTVSLGTLIMASQFLDLIWATLLLIGVEEVAIRSYMTEVTPVEFTTYPISHSLAMVFVWSLLFTTVHGLIKQNWGAAIVVGLCVLSHWVLDLVVHVPDLQLHPGGESYMGFGLWNSLPGTFLVETAIFIIGVVFYLRVSEEENGIGLWGLWALIFVLALIYIVYIFGPAPASETTIIVVGHLQWLLVIWGYWVDHNRFADPLDIVYEPAPIGRVKGRGDV